MQAVLTRHPRARGAAKLRPVLTGATPATLSKLERGFLRLLKSARIPRPPEVNRRAGSKRVDFRWPQERVTVELDSYAFHNSRHSWEQDRIRERAATRSAATRGRTCSRTRGRCSASSRALLAGR